MSAKAVKICDHGPYDSEEQALASAPYAIARQQKTSPWKWYAYWPPAADIARKDQAATRVQQSIEIVSLRSDLMTHVYPAFEYSWGKYTPRRATTGLIAEGKVGKSTLSLMKQLHSAAGLPFLGQPTMKGLNFYLSCEDDIEIVERRAQKILRSFSEADRETAQTNFRIINGVGKGLHFVTYDRNAAQISGTVDAIISAVKAAAGARASEIVDLACDTVSRLNGGQENDNNVMAMVEAGGARIAQALNCAVTLLHHTSKASAREGMSDAHTGRGGSSFGDNCRSVLRLMPVTVDMVKGLDGLNKDEVQRGDVLKLVHAALNCDRRSDDIYMRRTANGLLERLTPTIRNEGEPADTALASLVVWFKKHGTPFTVSYAARTARLEWTRGMSERSAKAFVERAVNDGHLIRHGVSKGSALLIPSPEMMDRADMIGVHRIDEDDWLNQEAAA